jgi:mono/diheme cytochrome c family protein
MKKELFLVPLIIGSLALTAERDWNSSLEPVSEPWQAPAWADTLKNPLARQSEAAMKGKENFDVYCWSCHGKKGLGDGAAGASFAIKPANLTAAAVTSQSDGALFWKLRTGRGDMPAFGDLLTETERWELVSFIRLLSNDRN